MISRIIACLAITGVITPAVGAAQDRSVDPAEIRHRNDCRLAAQVLTHGQPAKKRSWAMNLISSCPEHAGPALATLWREATEDTLALQALFWRSYYVRDHRIYEAASQVLRDEGNPPLVRLTAMGVLASYYDPHTILDLEQMQVPSEHNPQWWPAWAYLADEGGVPGSEPLEPETETSTMDLVREIAGSDPNAMLRDNAQALLRRWGDSP